jgi:hypothetical protein
MLLFSALVAAIVYHAQLPWSPLPACLPAPGYCNEQQQHLLAC